MTPKPRAACAMPAHAFVLASRQREHDQADAHRMQVFARLRAAVHPGARILILAGIAGGLNVKMEVTP